MQVSRQPVLVGANPGLRLFDGDTLTAYASVWRVDWSVHGSGTALVLWRDAQVRVLGEDVALAAWLERAFVRHFPEADGLPWPEPVVEATPVHVELDLAAGLQARAGDVELTASGVLDRRTFATDSFVLGDVEHSLSLVLAPCDAASLTIGGVAVPGAPEIAGPDERPSSSAFLAVAEVWSR